MKKMKFETDDLSQKNIEKIGGIFPNCITETKDENGELKKAIDFEMLKQMLSDDVIDEGDEAYEFTWVGKKEAMVEANKPIRKTLRPCKEESKDWDNTENLYIEGDNLEVLKLLQESYLNKVKMIYIDPPYNTGNDFIYNDDFKMDRDEYKDETGEVDEEGNRLFKNTDTNGRFHSDWCSMMYSRLMLARNLLSEDGVIFISIDDNEQENLKRICNEVFGNTNFIGNIIWKSATDNNIRQITTEHEYILCYANDFKMQDKWCIKSEKAKLIENQYEIIKRKNDDIDYIQKELRQWIKKNKENLKGVSHYNNVDEMGVYSNSSNSSNTKPGGYMFDIIHPITKKPCVKPAFGWRWTEKTFWDYDNVGDIEWGRDESTQPHVKKRINTVNEQLKSIYYEDGRASTKLLEKMFGEKKVFDNPKAMNLIRRLIDFTSDKNSIIFDFFSGSATTAHAVMDLNAEDGGNRKFIMVQLPEECDEKSAAYKAGYKNICEIGKERIRRAGKKIKEDNADKEGIEDLDIGFRVLKLDDTNMKDIYYTPDEYSQRSLFDLESNIKEDRTELDLLYGCLIEWGIPLNKSYESTDIEGSIVHIYNEGDLIACFDEDITEEAIKKIAKMEPLRAVFRDSSFKTSAEKINVEEIFKLLSPETSVRVI